MTVWKTSSGKKKNIGHTVFTTRLFRYVYKSLHLVNRISKTERKTELENAVTLHKEHNSSFSTYLFNVSDSQ